MKRPIDNISQSSDTSQHLENVVGFKQRLSRFKTDASSKLRRLSTRKQSIGAKSDLSVISETVDLTDYEIDEFDDLPPDFCRNRCDKQSHAFVNKVVESAFFNGLLSATIMINILFLVFEAIIPDDTKNASSSSRTADGLKVFFQDYFKKDMLDVKKFLKRMDGIFLSVYLLEFLLKFYVSPLGYWKQWANKLDFIILIISFTQVFMNGKSSSGGGTSSAAQSGSDTGMSSMRLLRGSTNVKFIKTLRAFRALRTLKSLTLVRGAQVIFGAIIRSQKKSIANVISIMMCFIFLMSMLTYTLFYDSQPDPKSPAIEQTWGCFQATLASLFMVVTCDGWYEIQASLEIQFEGQYSMIIMSRFVMIFIVLIGHFVIFNIFVAINIMQVQEANQDYNEEIVAEREAILQRKKDKILQRQYDDVKKLREEQEARGCSFHQMIENFKNTLKHEDYTLTEDIITDVEWMTNFSCTLDMLDNTTYKLQQLFFEYTNAIIYSQNEELRRRIGS